MHETGEREGGKRENVCVFPCMRVCVRACALCQLERGGEKRG